MSASLVGSEMCIRDRKNRCARQAVGRKPERAAKAARAARLQDRRNMSSGGTTAAGTKHARAPS
eukprot:2787357-Alexandrium_andersonii.AAC.1